MSAIAAFFGRLFGSDKAVSSLIDHTANALDKVVYTSEEKADDAARSVTEARGMLIDWLKNTQGQNLSRRVLAFMIAATWLGMYVCSAVMAFVAIWASGDIAKNAMNSAIFLGEHAVKINIAMGLILVFYFAAPNIGTFVTKFTEKFTESK